MTDYSGALSATPPEPWQCLRCGMVATVTHQCPAAVPYPTPSVRRLKEIVS